MLVFVFDLKRFFHINFYDCVNSVDRLHALQVIYQENVEQLEKDQEKQRVTAQRSLKNEMHSLQKRLLEDSVSVITIFVRR